MKKHRKWSIIEATFNTTIGFIIGILIQIISFPLIGIKADLKMMTSMSFIFVMVSIIKNYFTRELFRNIKKKWKLRKKSKKFRAAKV